MAAILPRLLVGFALLVANRATFAGVEAPSSINENSAHSGAESTPEESSGRQDADPAERARVVEVGVWVLLGVVMLAGVVVTTLLMYGAHARRVARTPLPEQTRDDAFWYLRKPKNVVDDPASQPTKTENEPDPEP